MPASPKIVVLGSNSFSGASFISEALTKGAQVIGMSRSQEQAKVFLPYQWLGKNNNFRFVAMDLNRNLGELFDLMKTEKPDYFVNFAAQSMVGQSWEHPEDWFQTNVVSTAKLYAHFSRECPYLKKFVQVTTPEVYGSTNGWIKEGTAFDPSTPYAVSRAAADMNLRNYIKMLNFPATFTRAANVYGPGQQLYRIIPRTILYIRLGEKLRLEGGGQSRRSFIHIKDVSDATWNVMTKGVIGQEYHISTNEIISIKNLVERICNLMEVNFDDTVEMAEDRLGKDTAYMLENTLIRNSLGWSDKTSLDQGLEECIAWVDDNLNELKTQNLEYIHKP